MALLASTILTLATGASAATLTVGVGQPYATISAALSAASGGDRIEVMPGTYAEQLTINKSVEVVGVGAPGTVIVQSTGASPLVRVTRNARLQAVTLDATGVRGINVTDSTFELLDTEVHSAVRGSWEGNGGGLAAQRSDLLIERSWFHDNTAENGGALSVVNFSSLTIRDSVFEDNIASSLGLGGALHLNMDRPLLIEGSTFTGNSAGGFGGAIYVFVENGDRWDQQILDNTFCSNAAAIRGGAIDAAGQIYGFARNELAVKGNVFQGNDAADGGAMSLGAYGYYLSEYWTPVVVQNTFVDNSASNGAHISTYEDNVRPTLFNNLFAGGMGGGAALTQEYRYGTRDWNLWYANPNGHTSGVVQVVNPGANALIGVDPMVTSYTHNGFCDDDLAPLPGSPLIDGGHPGFTDPDLTRSDIGAL